MSDLDNATVIRLFLTWFVLSALFMGYRSQLLIISKKQWLGIFSRLIVSWLALFFFYTNHHLFIIKTLLPVFSFLLNNIQNEYTVTLSSIGQATESIKMDILILRDIAPFKPGVELYQYFNFLPILQQMALLPATLIAWPVKHFQARLILLIMSLFLTVVLLMLTVPFLMAYQFETTFKTLAGIANFVRPTPYYQWWVQFITNDGHYIVIVFMVIFTTKIQRKITHHFHPVILNTT